LQGCASALKSRRDKLENEKSVQIEQQKEKPKRKKKGKIARVFELHQKGVTVKDISKNSGWTKGWSGHTSGA
jgi:hypothetical protein